MPGLTKPTPEMKELLRRSGSRDKPESLAALAELANAIENPIRKGVLAGDILGDIFTTVDLEPGASAEFELDFVAPGTEKEFVAYTIPNHGRIPEKHIEGDYVLVPTFDVGGSIDWLLKYARDARWDVISGAAKNIRDQFIKKNNDDGFQVVCSSGFDRNIVVLDSDASSGQFTKRLVSLMKVVMRRNGGGNSTSINRGKLTDLYVSPEANADVSNWGVDQIDETTRREIFTAEDGKLLRIFQVNLHELDELGVGQELQLFYTGVLGGSMPSGDVEICIGLDLENRDAFVSPVREDVSIFEDDTLHRSRRAGLYGWQSRGFANLDNRRVILGSM